MIILNILMWITAIISIASVIAAITPTPKDDVWFSKLYKIIDLPTLENNEYNGMVLGHVVGIHIKDEVLDGGKVNIEKIKPLSRLGYLDYSVVDNIFEMHRPEGSPRPDK